MKLQCQGVLALDSPSEGFTDKTIRTIESELSFDLCGYEKLSEVR